MRIAFVGKGGSGKTTFASIFALAARQYFEVVLLIDADINQHTAGILNVENISSKIPLAGDSSILKKFIKGTNERIEHISDIIKTTPPASGAGRLSLREKNPVWDTYMAESRGVHMIRTGEIIDEDIGVRCYHAKTGNVELLLNHLKDEKDECVIVDMTAGADAFSSGLFTKFDLTCVVVEPTLQSISVYKQYKRYCKEFNVPIIAVGNKIEDESDSDFLKAHLNTLQGSFYSDPAIRRAERGMVLEAADLDVRNQQCLDLLIRELLTCERDWERYREQVYYFHKTNALHWGNSALGKDLIAQIDPAFSYELW